MLLKLFTLVFDAQNHKFLSYELDVFCNKHKIIDIKYQLIQVNNNYFWTVAVLYENFIQVKNNTPKQTEIVDPLFENLQVWRNQTAQAKGFPPYIIATNKQLLQIAELKPTTLEALKQINKFGAKTIENYGSFIIEIVKNYINDGTTK